MKRLWLFLSLIILLTAACSTAGSVAEPTAVGPTSESPAANPTEEATTAPAQLRPIRLPMGFIADPQYAPFYMAVDKGYYAAEGLEIEFDYSFETDGVALVGANELPLAIVSGEQVLLGRAQGLPLVYVLEWFQKFPIAVVSKTSANIQTPQDLVGRTVGLPGFFGASYVGYAGLLSAVQIDPATVNVSEIGFNQIESLLTNQSEAVVVYGNNEPVQLAAMGEAVNVIYVADYIDMVANGLVTNEATIANEPELVQGFVRATLRGLVDVLANPADGYEISKKFVEGLDDSRRNVLEASLEMWRADTLGMTDGKSWENTQAVLLGIGFLDGPLDKLESFYTNEFVLAAQAE